MARNSELRDAFDAAIAATRSERSKGISCADGSSAVPKLDHLETDLLAQQRQSLESGAVDREWFQRTVRWLVEWLPEGELTLIAALGRIARVKPSSPA